MKRSKTGKPSGYVKFHAFNELGEHAAGIREALKTLKKDDPIDYQSQDYKPIKIGAPGTVYGNKGYGFGGRMTPEDRRSIERQKALDITARVFESLIGKSETKTQKSFGEIMDEIRAESRENCCVDPPGGDEMTPFNFLRKKITPGLSLESVEFLTYLLTYVSNLFRILVSSSSSSKLRKASLVVVVVVGRWFL